MAYKREFRLVRQNSTNLITETVIRLQLHKCYYCGSSFLKSRKDFLKSADTI